jgi:hypothetical protein
VIIPQTAAGVNAVGLMLVLVLLLVLVLEKAE